MLYPNIYCKQICCNEVTLYYNIHSSTLQLDKQYGNGTHQTARERFQKVTRK